MQLPALLTNRYPSSSPVADGACLGAHQDGRHSLSKTERAAERERLSFMEPTASHTCARAWHGRTEVKGGV